MDKYVMEDRNKGNRLDNWVSLSLRLGIIVSLALVAIGLVLISLAGTKGMEPVAPPGQILQGIVGLKATAIITMGILVLIVTPILPVLVAIVTFSAQRNKLYSGVSITVLCFLILSFVLALT